MVLHLHLNGMYISLLFALSYIKGMFKTIYMLNIGLNPYYNFKTWWNDA